jgi:hypothetical protein
VPSNGILLELGKSLERMLTMEEETFEAALVRGEPDAVATLQDDEYHYTAMGDLLMRSQLDCYDPGLGGTFDLKTRATTAVRCDVVNYLRQSSYRINRLIGFRGSFEREFYDMARAAFAKYSLQARIGHMKGIFVAYHSTAEFFGFEFFSTEDMDRVLFGSVPLADALYSKAIELLTVVLTRIRDDFAPAPALRCHLQLGESRGSHFQVWVEEDSADGGWSEKRSLPGDTTTVLDDVTTHQLRSVLTGVDSRPPAKNPSSAYASLLLGKSVSCYTVAVNVYVNDEYVYAPYNFGEGDRLSVKYRVEREGPFTADTLPDRFLDALRLSDAYDLPADQETTATTA